jgi:cytochrome P450
VCIGEQFAWMEGALLIATLAQRWKMRLAPGQRVEPKAMITLRPRYGMKMIIETREQALAPTSGNVDTTRLSA